LRVEDADPTLVPLDADVVADAAGRDAVVRLGDFDATVRMHGTRAEGVVAKRRGRERVQVGSLLGKHRRDLPLGGPMDARVGPAGGGRAACAGTSPARGGGPWGRRRSRLGLPRPAPSG